MGIHLSYLFSNQFPFHFVSEQVLVLPQNEDLSIASVGWPKIVYFFSGTADIATTSGETYKIGAGDTIVLAGAVGQRYLAGPPGEHVWMHALVICFARPHQENGSSMDWGWDLEMTRYLSEVFSANMHLASGGSSTLWDAAIRLRNACNAPLSIRCELARELAYSFILRLAEFAGIHKKGILSEQAELVKHACDRVLRYSFEKSLRQNTAKELGVSVATLDRSCRAVLGVPFASYTNRVRLERSKSLLLSSCLLISAVAKELHFSSVRHFCRSFKAATGLTPTEYQQSFKGVNVSFSSSKKREKRPRPGLQSKLPKLASWRIIELPQSLELKTPCILVALEGGFLARVPIHSRRNEPSSTQWVLNQDTLAVLFIHGGRTVECEALKGGRGRVLLLEGSFDRRGNSPQERAIIVDWAQAGGRLIDAKELPFLRDWLMMPLTQNHATLTVQSLVKTLWWAALRDLLSPPKQQAPMVIKGRKRAGNQHQLLISHAKEFIKKHASRNLTLGEISWAVGVSEEHLARVFRAECDTTVMAFRMKCRILRAQSMLVRTQKPINAIAEALGFSSLAHFYRSFKEQVGCTPSEFRKKGEGALP